MELEISPQATEEERAAIELALARTMIVGDAAAERGAWWAAGVAENVDLARDDP